MLPGRILTVFLSIISTSIALIVYNSTTLDESIVVFDNPIFSLENSDGVEYLQIAKKLSKSDNLYFTVILERFDGVIFFIPEDPISLCELLEKETNGDNILSKLQFSSIFSMEGLHCPIPAGKRKLMPYIFPQHVIELYNIHCGQFNCKVTIESCDEETMQNCTSMIFVEIIADLQAEDCFNIIKKD